MCLCVARFYFASFVSLTSYNIYSLHFISAYRYFSGIRSCATETVSKKTTTENNHWLLSISVSKERCVRYSNCVPSSEYKYKYKCGACVKNASFAWHLLMHFAYKYFEYLIKYPLNWKCKLLTLNSSVENFFDYVKIQPKFQNTAIDISIKIASILQLIFCWF